MIHWGKSAELNNMSVLKLTHYFAKYQGSGRHIIAVCEICGDERSISYQNYQSLCKSCAQHKRYKDPLERKKTGLASKKVYDEHPESFNTEAHKIGHIKSSKTLKKYYKDNPEVLIEMSRRAKESISPSFYEKQSNDPEHGKRISAGRQHIPYNDWNGFISNKDWRDWDNVIYMNDWFPGCERHHIDEDTIICIPKELHRHIWHDLRKGYGMTEINILAFQFISGHYNE